MLGLTSSEWSNAIKMSAVRVIPGWSSQNIHRNHPGDEEAERPYVKILWQK